MRKTAKALILTLLAVALVLTGCGGGSGSSSSPSPSPSADASPTASPSSPSDGLPENVPAQLREKWPIKIAVVRKIGGDDHTAQYLAGAKEEGEAMGFTVDTFSANGDSAKFHDTIQQVMNQDYDGIIISHGDDEATIEEVRQIVEKGIPVVTFDSIDGLKDIPGVTMTAQDDFALAELSLGKLVEDFGGQAKIVYLWVDGFPPMIRRNQIYQKILSENPGIQEIDRFGVAAADTSVQTQNAVAAMLTKYPKGQLDAIFATWDAFAIGATRAVNEAGRQEVKIYGIDVSNADLQAMQEENSPWVATAAVDPKMIGAVNVRLLAKKIAGEETPATYDLEAALITQEDLKKSGEPVNMVTLANIIPGWGQTDAFEEDWMKALKEANK